MSKLVKGFLIAAVVLILFGLVLCAGGAAAGGAYEANKAVRSVIKDKDYQVTVDKEDVQITAEKEDSKTNYDYVGMNEADFLAEDVRSLEIKIGTAEVEIVENNSSDSFSVYTDGGEFNISVKRGTLTIKSNSKLNENKLYVEIPTGFEFDEVDISAGAASVDIQYISAKKVDMEIGAGAIEIGTILAREAEFEIGAGEITVSDGNVEKCSVDVDLGNFQYDGTITRECDVECGMGNAEIRLDGKEEDYNYEIECSAGNVNIGGTNYSGLAYGKHINNRAAATIEIECSMGNVTIEF